MSHSDRRNQAELRSVADTLFWLCVGAVAVYLFSALLIGVRSDRSAVQQAAESACTQGEEQACNGSYADVRAANAAEQMVDLTVIQFLAGIVGIVLVGLTLKATRDAVREANDATETAAKALEITKRSYKDQLRAYMTVESADPTQVMPGSPVSVRVTFKNTGQTPAKNLRAVSSVIIRDSRSRLFVSRPDISSTGSVTIGRDGEYELNGETSQPLILDDYDSVNKGRKSYYVLAHLTYDDIYGRPHFVTSFFESTLICGALSFRPALNGTEST